MVRKMAYIGSGYFLGLIFASFFNSGYIIITAIFISSFLSLFVFKKFRKEIIVTIISCVLGFTVFSVYDLTEYKNIKLYTGNNVELNGIITDISKSDSHLYVYTVKTKINGKPCCVNLNSYNLKAEYFDRISFKGKLNEYQNSYLFNAKDFNESRNIIFNVSSPENIEVKNRFSILRYILNYRDYICKKISDFLPESEGGFINAMLCGDKSGIDNDVKLLMYRSGIGHIMAVSGAHLSILAAIVLFISEKLKFNKNISFVVLCGFSLLFCIFSGLSISVIRSAVMVMIVYSAPLFKRQYDVFNALGIAIILLTIFQPYCIKDPSFLLSVSGTFGIGVLAPYICSNIKYSGRGAKTLKALLAFLCANIAVMPASLIYFDEFSIISPVTNLILVPLCMIALVLIFIVVLTGGINIIAFPVIVISGLICKVIIFSCNLIGKLNFTYLSLSEKYIIFILACSFIGILIAYKLFKTRTAVICLCISLCVIIVSCILKNNINKEILTIGYFTNSGHSCMIIVNGHNAMLINKKANLKTLSMARKFMLQNHVTNIEFYDNNIDDYRIGLYNKYFSVFDKEKVNHLYSIEEEEENIYLNYGGFNLILTDGKINDCKGNIIIVNGDDIPECSYNAIITNKESGNISHYHGNTLIKCNKNGELLVRSI